MTTTTISVKPGGTAKLRYPLNYCDRVTVALNWEDWLDDGDTVSSAVWTASSGLTATGTGTTDTTTTATIEAGTSVTGNLFSECQMTTVAGSVRSVRIQVEVVDLL